MTTVPNDPSAFSEQDVYLWNEGTHFRLYEKLGAHVEDDKTRFAVWAPNAEIVSVVGDWNGWDAEADPMRPVGVSGIWELAVARKLDTSTYKYHIVNGEYSVDKADPFGFHHETPPHTASKVWTLDYDWQDQAWIRGRNNHDAHREPISIYEVHLGSWRRNESHGHLTYLELADQLPAYVAELGFTHVELLPVMEHPFFGSWGYQTTGYYAPTSRYGTPQDFMFLVDSLHQAGVGVYLDWVPSHFPNDEHGLAFFDGTHLYEHADPRQGIHPDWDTYVFNYGRAEVPAFLISNALFWLDIYHADGLRVDAVASMLYLDYSRRTGEWIPNPQGGRENLEAVAFLRRLNEAVYTAYPDTEMIAEESTAWPMVSKPTSAGGLGFGFKWDMGWMHDILNYMEHEPVNRAYHHNRLTFRSMYAFTENFVLPLSHDEVVHGKGSLLAKMPGDRWQQYANLRLLLCQQYTQPGKKLLFMGAELAQASEWDHDGGLHWPDQDDELATGISRLVGDLNRLYRDHPALHVSDTEPNGFEWAVADDATNSVLGYFRSALDSPQMLIVHNLTPVPRPDYRVGVPLPGRWAELLNSDARIYGGTGSGNLGGVTTGEPSVPSHGNPESLVLSLPPLASVVLAAEPL